VSVLTAEWVAFGYERLTPDLRRRSTRSDSTGSKRECGSTTGGDGWKGGSADGTRETLHEMNMGIVTRLSVGIGSPRGCLRAVTGGGRETEGSSIWRSSVGRPRDRIRSKYGSSLWSRPGWCAIIGYSYRLPNLNAALGCAQLERLPEMLAVKRTIAGRSARFCLEPGWSFVREPAGSESNYCPDGALGHLRGRTA
jgi:hypothetical protein